MKKHINKKGFKMNIKSEVKWRSSLLTFLLILSTITSFSQMINGKVVSVVSLGIQDYSIINESGTNIYFKTSAYISGSLMVSQTVLLETIDSNKIKVLSASTDESIYAVKYLTNTSGIGLPPMSKMPKFVNDILFFEDEQHLIDSRSEMDSYLNQFKDISTDSLLCLFERKFDGFVSYRSHFNTIYNLDNGEFTEEQIEKIEREDFICDEINKTILNKNRLVGIGNDVVYFHNLNQWVVVNMDDTDGIDILTQLDQKFNLYDSEIDIFGKKPFDIKSPLIHVSNKKGEDIFGDFRYTSNVILQNLNCSVFQKGLKVDVAKWEAQASTVEPWSEISNWTQNYNATLTVDWGDGSIDVIGNYTGDFIWHTYTSQGTFVPSTFLTWTEALNVIQLTDLPTSSVNFLVQYACTQAEDVRWSNTSSGNWKMTVKLWHTINAFGTHVGSYTHAWKKKSNGNWVRKKADIYTKVEGTFRNNDCTGAQTKIGVKHHTNDKKVQKTKSKIFKALDYYNNDVKSLHWLQKSGVYLQINLALSPC